MQCPECGQEVPEGHRFCGNCGTRVAPPAPVEGREQAPEAPAEDLTPPPEPAPTRSTPSEATPAEPPGAAPPPALAPSDTADQQGEREIWRGRYSNRAALGELLFALLLAIIGTLVILPLLLNPWGREHSVVRWIATILVVGPGLFVVGSVFWRWARRRFTMRYRLTTERLFTDRGFFNRTRDEIELIRVDDVRVRQSLWDRLFRVGNVEVFSETDATTSQAEPGTSRTHGVLVIFGVYEPDALKEKIRHSTRARRARSLYVERL